MNEVICPKCGSRNVHKVGAVALHTGHGYRCIDCGADVDGPDYDLERNTDDSHRLVGGRPDGRHVRRRRDVHRHATEEIPTMMHPFIERLLKWFFGITDKKGDKFR